MNLPKGPLSTIAATALTGNSLTCSVGTPSPIVGCPISHDGSNRLNSRNYLGIHSEGRAVNSTKCLHCHKPHYLHGALNGHCPFGIKTRSGYSLHPTNRFTPTPPKQQKALLKPRTMPTFRQYEPGPEDLKDCLACGQLCMPFPYMESPWCSVCWYEAQHKEAKHETV